MYTLWSDYHNKFTYISIINLLFLIHEKKKNGTDTSIKQLLSIFKRNQFLEKLHYKFQLIFISS